MMPAINKEETVEFHRSIRRETHPNEFVRDYHVKTLLMPDKNAWWCSDYNFTEKKTIPARTRKMRDVILALPGVIYVSVRAYEISVGIAGAFTWDETEVLMIPVFEKYLDLPDTPAST